MNNQKKKTSKNEFTEEQKQELRAALKEVQSALEEKLKNMVEESVKEALCKSPIAVSTSNNGEILSPQEAGQQAFDLIRSQEPEVQNEIMGNILKRLTVINRTDLSLAEENVRRRAKSLEQLITISDCKKYLQEPS